MSQNRQRSPIEGIVRATNTAQADAFLAWLRRMSVAASADSGDITFQLGDKEGATSLYVRDSAGVTQLSLDSDGNLVVETIAAGGPVWTLGEFVDMADGGESVMRGVGTAGYIPKFTAANAVGNTALYENAAGNLYSSTSAVMLASVRSGVGADAQLVAITNGAGIDSTVGLTAYADAGTVSLALTAIGNSINVRGNVIFDTDNTFDIGAVGSNRPKNVIASGYLTGSMDTMTYAAAITLDVALGNLHKVTTTAVVGNATINASGVGVAGQHMWVLIVNDATSGKVVTFGTNFRSAGTVTGTVSKATVVAFISDGTAWFEVSRTLVL